jgi:hypothetical protein
VLSELRGLKRSIPVARHKVALSQATNVALHLAGAGPSIGNGALRDRIFSDAPGR